MQAFRLDSSVSSKIGEKRLDLDMYDVKDVVCWFSTTTLLQVKAIDHHIEYMNSILGFVEGMQAREKI